MRTKKAENEKITALYERLSRDDEMVAGIEDGSIGTVIVKDMSRIGRDYLQVDFYTEVMFKEKEVHFIAIANGVDNQKRESSEFAPFLNIMNEWYIRDSSRKVTTVLRARGMEGKGPYEIARILSEEQIERPSYYLAKRGLGTCRSNNNTATP